MTRVKEEFVYEKRYIAFIDILGFSNLITLTVGKKPAITIQQILLALEVPAPAPKGQLIIGEIGDISKSDHRITQFSDSIVISVEMTEPGLMHLIDHVERIIFHILKLGFLCRGGIASGLLHHEENTVIGPAMIAAYKLENKIAKYPRIILSKKVAKDALSMKAGQGVVMSRMIYKCDDYYMVHVLRHFSMVLGLPGPIGQWEQTYLDVKRRLALGINRLVNMPKEKGYVEWFRNYFNETVFLSDGSKMVIFMGALDQPKT